MMKTYDVDQGLDMHEKQAGMRFHHPTSRADFSVWAPRCQSVHLKVEGQAEKIPLLRDDFGYWNLGDDVDLFAPFDYSLILDDRIERPDPASHYQPEGVHSPSRAINHHQFQWNDQDWKGLDQKDLIFYEIHVGTFSRRGDFQGVIDRLGELQELGITAIEIMPVSSFPGHRNWGYDGVQPYAVQNSYGGPDEFKRLIDAAHQLNLAVFLDVVYNHMGPEGNYLRDFGYYFTDRYHTPWGDAINFDDRYSFAVRNYFIQNALHWLEHYHLDGLRLDAVHAIYDSGALHFLDELSLRTENLSRKLTRPLYLFAESDLNDSRLIRTRSEGGYNLSGQWSDDFHHSVHACLTGERDGYYEDFGSIRNIQKALSRGFVYEGEYSAHRKRKHGNRSGDLNADRLIFCIQNHDQVGNRMLGERLPSLVSFEQLRLAAGLLLLSPSIPLLFMGEEYGETAPFLYFISHTDESLVEAVRKGRKDEFKHFAWKGEAPDPQSEDTYNRSKLNRNLIKEPSNHSLYQLYKDLIAFRKDHPELVHPDRKSLSVELDESKNILITKRFDSSHRTSYIAVWNFNEDSSVAPLPREQSDYELVFSSSHERYGNGQQKNMSSNKREIPGFGFLVFRRKN